MRNERQPIARAKVERGMKLLDNRDLDGRAGLVLLDHDLSLDDVPPAETDEVATPRRRAESQFEDKPFARAERIIGPVYRDIGFAPGRIPVALVSKSLDAKGRVVIAPFLLDRVFHQDRD